MSTTSLLLCTKTFPREGAFEHAFLDPELRYTVGAFDRVYVLPAFPLGVRRELPGNAAEQESYTQSMTDRGSRMGRLWRTAVSKQAWGEIAASPTTLLHLDGIRALGETVRIAARAEDWFKAFIREQGLAPEATVVYTYWLNAASLGAVLAKRELPGLKVVSRAHGLDLYHERHQTGLIPCQAAMVMGLDRLFTVSDHGRNYAITRYPGISERCEVARLGVDDPGVLATPSADGVFRPVSCSFAVPVKRLGLMAQGMVELARSLPFRRVEWLHMGGGPCLDEVRFVLESAPSNLVAELAGDLTHEEVHARYRSRPCDVFVNVSASEGVPVSVMEALSYGVPVIATKVGGTHEILPDGGGILLPSAPSPPQIAQALQEIASQEKESLRKRREVSRDVWARLCDAGANFSHFAKSLRELVV